MNFALEISRVDYVALTLLLGFHLFSHVGRGVNARDIQFGEPSSRMTTVVILSSLCILP